MQAKIDTLKAKNANDEEYLVYPRTLIKCVTNENGDNFEDTVRSLVSETGGTAEKVTYENESVADVTNVKEALDTIFDGTQQVGDSAKLGGKPLNDIVLQESKVVYVSPSGSDENGDGTEENPWKTIQKAVDKCPASYSNNSGYTVILANGVYTETVYIYNKVIKFTALDTVNTDVTLSGCFTISYNSIIELALPFKITDFTTYAAFTVTYGAYCYITQPLTIEGDGYKRGIYAGYGFLCSTNTITISNVELGVHGNLNSSIYLTDTKITDSNEGLASTNGARVIYNAVPIMTNVTTKYITNNGGRIYTGAQNELTTANKPTGTYTGNGSATSRTISTGGIGNTCILSSTNGMAIVTEGGAFTISSSGSYAGVSKSQLNFTNGKLTMASSNSIFNANGIEVKYQVP